MFPALGAPEDGRALLSAVEQQVDDGQVRHEVAMLLRVDGVHVVLPLHLDTVPRQERGVEVVARRAARQVAPGADVLAESQQPLALATRNAELGGPERRPLET